METHTYAFSWTSTTFQSWWHSAETQALLVEKPLAIAITIIVAVVASWALRKLITRVTERSIAKGSSFPVFGPQKPTADAQARAREERRQARLKTLSGMTRSAISIVVWLWAGLSILSTLGVDVTPLIASAGVVGVALGFGAQSLVKDFLSGIFMLMEDQYGIGDTIDVGEVSGTVEDVSMRITTLRDIDGTLWFVRNGEILRIGNFSQGYSVARLDIPVGLDNDIEAAKDAILTAATEASEIEDLAPHIIEPPTVDGVTAIKLDHMTIRVRVKVLPGQQWGVQREMIARILPRLRAAGISAPYTLAQMTGTGMARPAGSTSSMITEAEDPTD